MSQIGGLQGAKCHTGLAVSGFSVRLWVKHTHVGLFCPTVAASHSLPRETSGFLIFLFSLSSHPLSFTLFPPFLYQSQFFILIICLLHFFVCFYIILLVGTLYSFINTYCGQIMNFCCCFVFADSRAGRTLGNAVLPKTCNTVE